MMKKPIIGLSFSGGGYRAATFDLGVLSFLNAVKLDDGSPLLDCVVALSSVSGGTIPAMKYMLAKAQDQPVEEMVKEVFDFLKNQDLVDIAMGRIGDQKANPELSAIKIMSQIYDEYLFDNKELGVIIDNFDKIPVKDYTALATDFETSLPFRFRLCSGQTTKWTTEVEPSTQSDGKEQKQKRVRLSYPMFGNNENRINRDDAHYITPGEALACSSCFPSGFEPMMFPDDFKLAKTHPEIAEKYKPGIGLMDGGISDNQGIESILMSEKHLHKHRQDRDRNDKALDLLIVSDVASPYMKESYKPSKQIKTMGKLTIGRLRNYNLIAGGVILALFTLALVKDSDFWTGVMSVILAIVGVLNLAGYLMKKKMYSAIGKTFIGDRARFISHLKFATAGSLLVNRAKSLILMSSEVFLKRLRSLSYSSIYQDKDWKNRVITNTVYALSEVESEESDDEKKKSEEKEPRTVKAPNKKMQEISAQAASMGTTLWFTQKDKKAGMPEALFATGQFTICYKLLSYIRRIKKAKENDETTANLNEGHDTLIELEPRLLEFWSRFLEDPKCMLP